MNRFEKIIFIDDDEITNFLMKESLKRQGFTGEAVFFETATDALSYLDKAENASQPDVIFLDIKMPGMDGFDFLDQLAAQGIDQKIKARVYMLSSSENATDMKKSQEYAIVKGFLHKPFTLESLEKI